MKKIRQSNLTRPLLAALLVFIVVAALGFLYQETLQETVLVSFQYLLWLGGMFIKNLDQRYLWLQIVLVSLLFAFGLSSLFPSADDDDSGAMTDEERNEKGRIDFWQYRIDLYRSIRGRNNFILLDFPSLIVDTLAFHERKDPKTVKAEILSGALQVPEEVYGMVAMKEVAAEKDEAPQAFQGGQSFFQRISGRSKMPETAADARLEKVAAYLENLLEDENDI